MCSPSIFLQRKSTSLWYVCVCMCVCMYVCVCICVCIVCVYVPIPPSPLLPSHPLPPPPLLSPPLPSPPLPSPPLPSPPLPLPSPLADEASGAIAAKYCQVSEKCWSCCHRSHLRRLFRIHQKQVSPFSYHYLIDTLYLIPYPLPHRLTPRVSYRGRGAPGFPQQ